MLKRVLISLEKRFLNRQCPFIVTHLQILQNVEYVRLISFEMNVFVISLVLQNKLYTIGLYLVNPRQKQ